MGWRGVLVWGQSGTWLWRAAVVMVERSPSGAGPATKWRSTFIKNTLHQVCSFCLNNKLFTCNPAIYATATGYVRNKLESSKQTFSPSPAAAADVAGQWWDPETSSPDYDTLPVTLTHSWLPHPLLQSSVKKSVKRVRNENWKYSKSEFLYFTRTTEIKISAKPVPVVLPLSKLAYLGK